MYNTTKRVVLNTEFCGEVDLQSYLNTYNNMIKPSTAKEILVSLAKALAYLHKKGVCHRDIKLENVLINEHGVVKLIDFGFAVVSSDPDAPVANFCGTPAYMSPEIVKRKQYNGPKADIWALGILMYKIISGRFPFVGSVDQDLFAIITTVQPRISASVPQKLKALILRLLDKNPANRPSAEAILSDEWVKGE